MEQRNLLLAILVSIAILIGFQYLFPPPTPPGAPTGTVEQGAPPAPATAPQASAPGAGAPQAVPPQPPGAAPAPAAAPSRETALTLGERLPVRSPRVHGSIALQGGRMDDVSLPDYHVTVDPGSPEVVILSPPGSDSPYYAEFGWVPGTAGATAGGSVTPPADAVWTADGATLTPDRPVTLTWDNGQGLRFSKTYALDRDYMFTVTLGVENQTDQPVTVHPYGLVTRTGTPKTSGFYLLHEGPVAVLDGTLREIDYDDLRDKGKIEGTTTGGWLGITDKYWLVSLIPDQATEVKTRFSHSMAGNVDKYQADYLRPALTVAPGQRTEVTDRLFAGAKEVHLLDRYQDELGIVNFELAVDWGWFYFLTKPIFYALDWLKVHVGNFGLAILILTLGIKLLFFPLANKSYRAMSQMKKLQPEMMRLRERYGEDKQRLNQELMALYKKEKINPAAGCLPILVQIPVFFALYKVLFVSIELRHAPFYGWIRDLSAPDPTNLFNLFGLIPWTPPDLLHLGAWPLIMGVTMFLQQKLNPQPADPVQAKMFMLMPVFFTVLLAGFPAGLVIYWTWNNLLSILQQWVIMKRAGAFEERRAAAKPAGE